MRPATAWNRTTKHSLGVYNGGEISGFGNWRDYEELINRTGMKDGLLIYVMTGYEFPYGRISRTIRTWGDNNREVYVPVRWLMRTAGGYAAYSPVAIILQRQIAKLEDDFWLPNIAAKDVPLMELTNGQPMLFQFPEEIDTSPSARALAVATGREAYKALNARVQASGNRFLVFLAPRKSHVFAPFLKEPGKLAQTQEYYETSMARELRREGVPVIDLLPDLRARTREQLPKNRYLYQIDDTHWNAAGVALGVDAILRQDPALKPR